MTQLDRIEKKLDLLLIKLGLNYQAVLDEETRATLQNHPQDIAARKFR